MALPPYASGLKSQIVADLTGQFYGVLTDGAWKRFSGMPRLLLNGTGTVTIDARNKAGTVTSDVFTETVSSATDAVRFPFFGDDAIEVRAALTGTATAEII